MIYLDTSDAAKVLIQEDGSDLVRGAFADGTVFVSSKLLAVGLSAAADRRVISAAAARDFLDRVALVSLGDDILERAIDIHSGLCALDALHLATALELGDAVTSILTFGQEFEAAATDLGVPAAAHL